jgi:2-hydroxychromene-2-carboxylate isomerase
MNRHIEFFYDIGSPYSYFAARCIDDLARDTGLPVVWRPFLLGGVFKLAGNQPPASLPARAPYLFKDVARASAQLDIPFRMPAAFPTNTLVAMRTLAGMPANELSAASLKLFRAYWYDGADVATPEGVASIVGAEAVARAGDEAVKQKLKDNSEEAVRRGAFGAPTFFVGDEMFFGHDRMEQLKWWVKRPS